MRQKCARKSESPASSTGASCLEGYQPAENHFRALDATLSGLGVDRRGLLHVAQSLFHDHVPAKREGLPSVWINRRHDRPRSGATPEATEEWAFDLQFNSMADFADAVEQSFTAT